MVGSNNQVEIVIKAVNDTKAAIAAAQRDINRFVEQAQRKLDSRMTSKAVLKRDSDIIKFRRNESLLAQQTLKTDGLRLKNKNLELKLTEKNAKIKTSNALNQLKIEEKIGKQKIQNAKAEGYSLSNQMRQERLSRLQGMPSYAQRQQAMQARAASRQQAIANDNRNQFVTRAAVVAGAGAAAASYFSLGNYKTREQQRIRMKLHFGSEGLKVLKELEQFAVNTAFTVEDTIQLLEGVKLGSKGLGLDTPRQMVDFMKNMSIPLLAYTSNIEKRSEAAEQFRQIFSARKASERQDLRVIARAGIPIFEMIEEYISKKAGRPVSMSEIKNMYGAELPSWVVGGAVMNAASQPKMMRAMDERFNSFTQASDRLTDQLNLTSGSFGEVIDRSLLLGRRINKLSDYLFDLDRSLINIDPSTGKRTPNPYASGITKGMVAVLGGLGIGALAVALKSPKFGGVLKDIFKTTFKLGKGSSAQGGNLSTMLGMSSPTKSFGKSFAVMPSVMQGYGAGYNLLFTNYSDVVNDIIKDPAEGLVKNIDSISLSLLAMTNPITAVITAMKMYYDTVMGYVDPTKYSWQEKLADKTLNMHYGVMAMGSAGLGDIKGARQYLNKMIDIDKAESNYDKFKNQNQVNVNLYQNLDIKEGKVKSDFKSDIGGDAVLTIMSKEKSLNF